MSNISFRVLTYESTNDPQIASCDYTQKEALKMLNVVKGLMINNNDSFTIKEDWRNGVLFDILIEKFT